MKAWADLPPIYADRLMALLSDPARVYRGLHRTNALLLEADRTCHPHWLRPLRWAILYHDAVPAPQAPGRDGKQAPGRDRTKTMGDDAARGSMELWLEHFPAIHDTVHGVSGGWEQEVADVILLAADPFERPAGLLSWQQALLDLVCGDLGAVPVVYEANRLLAMAEATQAGLTSVEWTAARQKVLSRALACDRLYHCVHRDREVAARTNLRHELERT